VANVSTCNIFSPKRLGTPSSNCRGVQIASRGMPTEASISLTHPEQPATPRKQTRPACTTACHNRGNAGSHHAYLAAAQVPTHKATNKCKQPTCVPCSCTRVVIPYSTTQVPSPRGSTHCRQHRHACCHDSHDQVMCKALRQAQAKTSNLRVKRRLLAELPLGLDAASR
jgi:hypothetical protein